jgi:hypothetical protein
MGTIFQDRRFRVGDPRLYHLVHSQAWTEED